VLLPKKEIGGLRIASFRASANRLAPRVANRSRNRRTFSAILDVVWKNVLNYEFPEGYPGRRAVVACAVIDRRFRKASRQRPRTAASKKIPERVGFFLEPHADEDIIAGV
jgi:hypothetical protein